MFASPAEVTILKSTPQEIAVFFVFLIKIILRIRKRTGHKTGSIQSNNKALTPKTSPDTAYALSGVFSCDIYKYEYE